MVEKTLVLFTEREDLARRMGRSFIEIEVKKNIWVEMQVGK